MIESRILRIGDIDVEFVQCPAGSFLMGSDRGLPLELPVRRVRIMEPFWISTTLVTQKLWLGVMNQNPSNFQNSDCSPVDSVSYDAAVNFCQSATKMTGHQITLPTEAQWEYACRAGTETEYFWGPAETDARKFAWFELNAAGTTHPVASLAPNPWGLFDIVGNLWEWCSDVWHSDYADAPSTEESRLAESDRQPRRCLRGGAWDMDVFRMRSAYRSYDHRELGTSRFGLRLTMPRCIRLNSSEATDSWRFHATESTSLREL